jgi:single-stranded-DNA-specific exonuclease
VVSYKVRSVLSNPEYSAIINTLLAHRGIDDSKSFLNPSLINLNFFQELTKVFGDELAAGAELVKQAIRDQKPISIHGDYDVDGVCATAILWESIYYDLNYPKVYPFIPHRVNHGYGLSRQSIDYIAKELADRGEVPGLLITVDCGITANAGVVYAQELGFDVIITDHHSKPENSSDLPQGIPVLHTYQLCGAGIAWVFASFLRNNEEELAAGVDLVTLATLADLQELTGFNRSLVKHGLANLTGTKRPGLRSLYDIAGIKDKPIGVYEVGFMIGPRLNASGRLEHGLDALRLLVARNPIQAQEIALRLNEINLRRQRITEESTRQAMEMVQAGWPGSCPIIVSHCDWHEGVIGLIAAKLVERFGAPAIVISENGASAKGSARSVSGVNIVDLLRLNADHLLGVGGHEMAAGFSLSMEKLALFKEGIEQVNLKGMANLEEALLEVDLELPAELIGWKLYESLAQLEPFGVGNARPLFVTRGIPVEEVKTVGKTADHLKLKLQGGLNGIAFGKGSLMAEIGTNAKLDVIYSVDKDDYWGGQNIQLKIKDLEIGQN